MASAEMSSAKGSEDRFQAGGTTMSRMYPKHATIGRMVGMATEVDPQLGVLLGESTTEIDVARKNRVFCNRNLRMDTIEMIGFDMGYAPDILQLSYDPGWAIRGLVVDKKHGNVFKMDRHAYVGRCYHGFRELSHDERKATYRNDKINLSSERYEWLDTLFALPEAVMYTTLVDWADRSTVAGTGQAVDYDKLFGDIRTAIDEAHRDDTLKSVITG